MSKPKKPEDLKRTGRPRSERARIILTIAREADVDEGTVRDFLRHGKRNTAQRLAIAAAIERLGLTHVVTATPPTAQ